MAGRWRVILRGGVSPEVLGELRLAVEDSVLTGTLDWETSDSNPLPLTGRVHEDGEQDSRDRAELLDLSPEPLDLCLEILPGHRECERQRSRFTCHRANTLRPE